MQLFFSEKQVALRLAHRPSESTAATGTLSYEHNDKGNFLFSKQQDRLGAQPASCSKGTGGTAAHSSRFAADVKNDCSYAATPPYAVMV
jgi:hypothetical protein